MSILFMMALAACSLDPGTNSQFDPDAEFAKLDGPDVPTVQGSLERGAIQALAEGNHGRAVGLYEQLIDHNSDEPRYKLGLAESLRRIGEFKAASEVYDMVIRTQPENLDALEGKALALMGGGDTEQAAKLLERVLTRDGNRWRTLNALGILFAAKNMPGEAKAYLKEAAKVSPQNPSVLNNMGLVQAMQKHYSTAAKSFEDAARHAGSKFQRKQIELNHALVLGISGNTQAAEMLASKHLEDGALQNNLGLYAYLADNRELAKSYLNMALTGTNVFYKRAWDNLDIIAKEDQGPGSQQPGKRVKIQ